MKRYKEHVYYSLENQEIWIVVRSPFHIKAFLAKTWNDCCVLTPEHLKNNFYYIGEL